MPVSSNARAYLGSQLRTYYLQLVEIAMPDRLQQLIEQLQRRLDEISNRDPAVRAMERAGC